VLKIVRSFWQTIRTPAVPSSSPVQITSPLADDYKDSRDRDRSGSFSPVDRREHELESASREAANEVKVTITSNRAKIILALFSTNDFDKFLAKILTFEIFIFRKKN